MTDKIPARFLVGEVLLQSLSIDAVCSFKTVLSFEKLINVHLKFADILKINPMKFLKTNQSSSHDG